MKEANPEQLDRKDLIIAHEAIVNLLINDWSAMDRDALTETGEHLADALNLSPDSPVRYQD